MTSGYAELHCHTNFSFLEGASHPEDLVARAVELGLSAVAVTDHNGLYAATGPTVAFRDYCCAAGVFRTLRSGCFSGAGWSGRR